MAMSKRPSTKSKPMSGAMKKSSTARHNKNAYWKAYRELEAKADQAWMKFRNDVKKNAKSEVLLQDQSHLRLLLGECNYMARECMRLASKGKPASKKRKTR